MGQKQDFTEDEIKEAMDEKGVVPQLYYNSDNAYKTDYLGTGKINDEETYRLKVTMPSGNVSIEEYSIKSGLLLKEESTQKMGEQEMTVTKEYKNYVKAGSVMLPSEMTINQGMEINISYSDFKINEGVTEADFK